MKYIDYRNMKEFYTIAEVCHLFEMDKKELRYYSEKYGISPQEDLYGNHGFRKVLVRKLHNYIYKEQKNNEFSSAPQTQRKDPWEILTVKETAALLKTTRQQVRKMIVNEELPAVKVGREWRVLKAGIVEFFEKQICY